MGNKLGRRRQVVDEQYTRPQGLYQHKDVDQKKLRKLILDAKLAPCYPGDDECAFDREECPICFLYYPSLNRSRCCMKGICTECFLQMKPPHSARPTQCPFCKASVYAVEFRGVKTKEEKGLEQLEEQKVIEAKIRMQQQELLDEEERIQKRHETGSSSGITTPGEVEYRDVSSSSLAASSFSFPAQVDGIGPSQEPHAASAIRRPSTPRQNREDEFDLDLNDIMLMEAIWRSIQEHGGNQRNTSCVNGPPSEPAILEDHTSSPSTTPDDSSPSGGLACAIAALAERQHVDRHSLPNASTNAPFDGIGMSQQSGVLPSDERISENHPHESWIDVSPTSGRAVPMEGGTWPVDHRSDMVETGTGYVNLDSTAEAGAALPLNGGVGDQLQPTMVRPLLPESFEEQMMLAMAVSLAEARVWPGTQPLTWF
ncbi:hypothetical protein AAC387_Pa12g2186 [Persea americana]